VGAPVERGERERVYARLDARFDEFGADLPSRGTPVAQPSGVGYTGSRLHAPDEHIRLDDARRAVKRFAAPMMLF
jgi:hypothetical protein